MGAADTAAQLRARALGHDALDADGVCAGLVAASHAPGYRLEGGQDGQTPPPSAEELVWREAGLLYILLLAVAVA